MDIRFAFIPDIGRKPTFSDTVGTAMFIDNLKVKEKALSKFNYLYGKIYFKPGFYSTYKDGTEPRTYNNPRWWKTGATSCTAGCCTQVPEGLSESDARFEATEPAQIQPKVVKRSWQEFRRIGNLGGLEDQLKQIEDKRTIDKIVMTNYGYFQVI